MQLKWSLELRLGGLCDQLHNTTRLLDLAFGVFAEVACANDERDLRDTALAEDFAVAQGEEVENWCSVATLFGEVLLALLEWDEGPQLCQLLRQHAPHTSISASV